MLKESLGVGGGDVCVTHRKQVDREFSVEIRIEPADLQAQFRSTIEQRTWLAATVLLDRLGYDFR